MKKESLPLLFLNLFLLFLWQVGAGILNAAYILPTPTQILKKLWELKEPLFFVHLPSTLFIAFLGLTISIFLGLFFALFMDWHPSIQKALYPMIVTSQTIPIIAIAPLFILWFGYGPWSKIVVTVLITFFPIVINTYDGLQSTKEEMRDLLVTYGANEKQIFFMLKAPTALPSFFSSIKMAVPVSIIGATIGEWLGAQSGLGYFSKRMMTQLDGAGVFAPIVLLSTVAMLLVYCISKVEKHFITWRNQI